MFWPALHRGSELTELLTKFDFELNLRKAKSNYQSVPTRDQGVWENRLLQAFRRLPYHASGNRIKYDGMDYDVVIRLTLKSVADNIACVKTDYRTILKSIIGERAVTVAFTSTDDGFDLQFSTIDADGCIFAALIKTTAN
jgi:hypothetical protein